MLTQYEEKMTKTVENLEGEYATIRAGRANPNILNKIKVEYYGVPTPMQQLANITVPEARTLMIAPWEPSLVKAIEKAILNSDLGLTPNNDGKNIILNFPELTEERRKEIVKDIKKKGENAKVAIRNVRRDANDAIKKMEKAGKDEQVISYTDVVGTLMSSVTDIINTISYVLIAFVAISLVVSSIMIGVITYISVLERKKEIGILRAIGASKRNVSQVFNAETFIIGLCAGLIGIGLTLLLLLPGNMIIHAVADNSNVNAVLPVIPALVLIALSVVLTLLGGLIPSKKASKSDPVTALRTE